MLHLECFTGGGQHARETLLCTRNLEGPSFCLIAAASGGIYDWLFGMWHTAWCITGGRQHARETLLCTRNLEGPSFHLIAAALGGIYEWLFGMWHTACCITGGGQHARETLLCTRNLEGPSFCLITAASGGIYMSGYIWHVVHSLLYCIPFGATVCNLHLFPQTTVNGSLPCDEDELSSNLTIVVN